MKIKKFDIQFSEFFLKNGFLRKSIILQLQDFQNNRSWGEIAPLPKWSKESLQECILQLIDLKEEVLSSEFSKESVFDWLIKHNLFPSVEFGLESAIYGLLDPLQENEKVESAALFMGFKEDIINQHRIFRDEGFKIAKLKVSQLKMEDAFELIDRLSNDFRLRIDVNCAWNQTSSLKFFQRFPFDFFEYVEEPFENPKFLQTFSHPLAIDESFPDVIDEDFVLKLPTFNSLIYKPTIQGGMASLKKYQKNFKKIILSSSFESSIGLKNIACMAKRLNLKEVHGLGTYQYFEKKPLDFMGPFIACSFS